MQNLENSKFAQFAACQSDTHQVLPFFGLQSVQKGSQPGPAVGVESLH